ncbi:MAG: FMN-binding protein [Ruminococcus sp.]
MKNTFRDIIKPVVVLTCICLIVTALLAYVNKVTSPIIEDSEQKEAQAAMAEVLSEADGFKQIEFDKSAERVSEIYHAKNDTGYVFILITKGYGGDMKLICGIKSDGTIEATKTLSHSETSGLGSKTAEDPYKSQYVGKNADTLNDVDAISGATISSVAYINAIEDAVNTFELIKEGK